LQLICVVPLSTPIGLSAIGTGWPC